MAYSPGAHYYAEYTTSNTLTGFPDDADSLPTAQVVRNGADDVAGNWVSVTHVETGVYLVDGIVPLTYVRGDVIQVRVESLMGGIHVIQVISDFVLGPIIEVIDLEPDPDSIEFRTALVGDLIEIIDLSSGFFECQQRYIFFVLDHSTSMNAGYGASTRIQAARDALKAGVDVAEAAANGTKYGLVTYSHYFNDGFGLEGFAAQIEDPPGLTTDASALKTRIDAEGTGGYGTPTGDALAYTKTLAEGFDGDGVQIVILLASDGEWNIGTDPIPVAEGIVADHPTWLLYAVDVNDGIPNASNVSIGEIGNGFASATSPEDLADAISGFADPCIIHLPMTFEMEFGMSLASLGGCEGITSPLLSGIADTVDSAMSGLMLRVHRHAKNQMNGIELYHCREDQWSLFPIQPNCSKDLPVTISKSYRQPATMTVTIPDNGGLLSRRNRNSPYNYQSDGITFDPILDAKRKVLLRAGTLCWRNLTTGLTPTSSLAPDEGTLSELTDEVLGNIETSTTGFVQFTTTDDTPVDIDIDLGSVTLLQNYMIRLTTKLGTAKFPASVNWGWSTDGSTWHYTRFPRPAGGDEGDWDDDLGIGPETREFFRTDLEVYARYVRFRITPTGAQTFAVDELAVFGGNTIGFFGGNYFVGFLGGHTQYDSKGNIEVAAIDVTKKCIDNQTMRLTPQFGGNSPIDMADIAYTLLTSTDAWPQENPQYFAPFMPWQIGWSYGSNAARFKYPIWQGQSNSIYGYLQELMHSVGFDMPVDREGVIQLFEPPYRQVLPDRVLIADDDGNNDCWNLEPVDDDTDLRNKVIVRSGNPSSGTTSTVKIQPNSIERYGILLTEIDDPIAFDQATREKIASYFLRDYAFRLSTLTGTIKPDFLTHVKQVIAFRASRRMNLYANDKITDEDIRAQDLWSIDQYDEHIWVGDWTADIKCSQYVGLGPNSPLNLTATPRIDDDTIIDLHWDEPSDSDTFQYKVYYSTVSESSGFVRLDSAYLGAPLTDFAFGAVTPIVVPGTQYWFYMTTIGQNGIESQPSSVVTAVAGGAAGDESKWTITDLDSTFIQESLPADAEGLYEYEIFLTWTSPPVGADTFDQDTYGFKHGEFRFFIDGEPDNPLDPDSWIYQDEWHGDRVPSLLTWDRVTVGDLYWYLRFRSATDLSGHTIYCRVFTWFTTNGFHGPAHASNVTSVAIP